MRSFAALVLFVLGCRTAGWLGGPCTATGLETRNATLDKPAFDPPAWVFALVARTAASFGRVVPLAGPLFLPYIVWIAFAGVLNAAIWHLNG